MHCDTNSAILIPSYYIPNGLKGHIEIVMHKNVSHSGNRGPVNLGMPALVPRIDPLRRFAKNLEVANNSVLERARTEIRFPARRGILKNPANARNHLLNVCALRFHSGTASRRTSSRIK